MNQSIEFLEAYALKTDERLKQLEQKMGYIEDLVQRSNKRWERQIQRLLKKLAALENY